MLMTSALCAVALALLGLPTTPRAVVLSFLALVSSALVPAAAFGGRVELPDLAITALTFSLTLQVRLESERENRVPRSANSHGIYIPKLTSAFCFPSQMALTICRNNINKGVQQRKARARARIVRKSMALQRRGSLARANGKTRDKAGLRRMQTLLKSKGADDAKDIFNEVQSDPRYAALRPWAVGLDCVERMEKPLAKGASGAVHRGFLYERVVACKVLANITVQSVDSFLNEALLLSDCSHPSIIQLIGVCLDAREPVRLVSEGRAAILIAREHGTNRTIHIVRSLSSWSTRAEVHFRHFSKAICFSTL